ncbi:DUF2723 domain-containing protein [Geobacter sp. AOG2]|uniref:glycosyltransferase family 117 protein n=1 Tax=Geobacter sp. AOG2 TaxID=1566347 RepID=UPI001CC4226D|nr:DUF2723 domain-containing protein [Geobacter sp. AOG2]GFE61220.1 membrane protein [Geobacter sp. AOG2]
MKKKISFGFWKHILPEGVDPYLILAFTIPFAVYMATLAPSVTFFDSGEFLTATYSLGSAHSPGYPLFLMYAKPFTWLPFGNIAFRINMATAFSSSLACMSVYLLTIHLLKEVRIAEDERLAGFAVKAAGLAAALAFGVTPRLWLQSNHDKPYPILAFITAIIFLLLLKWREHFKNGNEQPAYIYACTFLAGMSMAAHQSVVLLLPSWFLLIMLTDWRMILRIKELILATAFALFGFSVHLYLPLRATQNPLLNWGDPKTYGQFMWHFLRKGYPSEPHPRDAALWWAQIKAFNIPHEFTWLGGVLAVFALVCLWRRQREVVIVYGVGVVTFLAVIAGYLNTPYETIFLTEEFFTPLYLLTAVLIGVGLFHLLGFALRKAQLPGHYDLRVYLLAGVMFFVLPVSLCAVNYYENDQHNNYIAYDYATNSLRSLPQNAIMFTWGDSGAFPLWYLQGVERMREDVDLPHTPHLVFDWYLDSMPRVFRNSNLRRVDTQSLDPENCLRIAIAEKIDQRPVFIDFSTRYSVTFNEYIPVQKGLVYRIRRSSEPVGLPDISVWENYNNRGILEKISFLDLDTGKAILIYANSYLETGEFLLSIGRSNEGMRMLVMAEQISPEMKPNVQQVLVRYGLAR